jgi:hypothetical protein
LTAVFRIKDIIGTLRELMTPTESQTPPKRSIGFVIDEKDSKPSSDKTGAKAKGKAVIGRRVKKKSVGG